MWHGAQRVQLVALVDSGADRSLIDASYAPLLGLDRAKAVERAVLVAGGGTLKCLEWTGAQIEFEFAGERFPFEGNFVDFPAGSDPFSVLGRADFFSKFVIQFWDAADMFNVDLSPDHIMVP